MKKWWWAVLSAALVVATLFAGCSSPSVDSTGYDAGGEVAQGPAPAYDADNGAKEEASAEPQSGGAGETIDNEDSMLQPVEERKIIYYGDIQTQTENFDEDYNAIRDKLTEFKGYVQSSSVSGTEPNEWQESGRTAQMTLRVPSDKFDEFMGFLGSLGDTLSTKVSGEDISLQYFDIETKLTTLRTREDRLQALLEKAETMQDIISLEQALADVSYEIRLREMDLRNYDSLIDYSSVTIYLQEVNVIDKVTPSEKTLGERISSGFYSVLNVLADFGEGLLIFLIAGSPILLPLGGIIFLIVWLTRRSRRKRAQKTPEHIAPRGAGAHYDPRTGYPYYNNADPKEGKQNDGSDKDSDQ
jgi:hypothetical protein